MGACPTNKLFKISKIRLHAEFVVFLLQGLDAGAEIIQPQYHEGVAIEGDKTRVDIMYIRFYGEKIT